MEPGQEPEVGEVIYLKEKRQTPPKLAPEKPKKNQTEAVAVINQRKKVIAENMHEVQKGETIEQIAEKYKTSVLNLVRWNDLETAEVKQGQILVLSPSMKPVENPENFVDTRETIKSKYHTVLRSETVYSIARLYNLKPDSIIAWNNLKGKSITEDQVLKLRREKGASNDASPSKTMSDVANIHFVKPGDTLYSIATKYGISVDKLKKLNNIDKNSISIGQKLILQ
jgi:LysM repeat protein